MSRHSRQRGIALVAIAALLALAVVASLAAAIARSATGPGRAAASDRALAQAREALLAYASARPLDAIVGPGYLPCPDLDDDGWAESTCGSMTGETGQWQRLGRLPWKTLGLPDLRDASGERLWYAVSSKHKGLLNCAASPACLDMGPEAAIGTITVRDAAGNVLHDGTAAGPYEPGKGGAVAVIVAPGPPVARWSGPGAATVVQERSCGAGQCNAAGRCLTEPPTLTPRCDPANYLDRAPGPAFSGEDNARFVDRNDAAGRPANRDGFILGPVASHDGTVWVNDRLAVVSYDDLMPRVMRRVAEEVATCLRGYAAQPGNRARLPWAAPLCRARATDPAARWAEATGVRFGRVPDTPFLSTSRDSGTTMLPRWPADCRIADASGDTASAARFTWWSAWKRHVFYSVASSASPAPGPAAACDSLTCLFVSDEAGGLAPPGHPFAVLVAGPPLLFDSGRQSRGTPADTDAREWLEGANADLRRLNANPAAADCDADSSLAPGPASPAFNRVERLATRSRNDVVVVGP
jgi:type II secretory pathway pseudopilin PulG